MPKPKLAPWLIVSLSLLLGSSVAWADEPPPREVEPSKEQKAADDKEAAAGEKADEARVAEEAKQAKKGGCAIGTGDDALIGLGALVLLVSGAGLRRRR